MGLQLLSSLEDTLSRQSSYTGASRLDRSALGNGCVQHWAIGVLLCNAVSSISPSHHRVMEPFPDTGAGGGHLGSLRSLNWSAQSQDIAWSSA